jgi:hypothetical protein
MRVICCHGGGKNSLHFFLSQRQGIPRIGGTFDELQLLKAMKERLLGSYSAISLNRTAQSYICLLFTCTVWHYFRFFLPCTSILLGKT